MVNFVGLRDIQNEIVFWRENPGADLDILALDNPSFGHHSRFFIFLVSFQKAK